MEPSETGDSSSDDDYAFLPATVTPYLLFYSDVLKELNSTMDAIDIAKEARARWSKITSRSLKPYVEAASLMQINHDGEPIFKKKGNTDKAEPFSLKNVKSSREIFKLRRMKEEPSNDMLQRKEKNFEIAESKHFLHSACNNAKRPTNWGKMIDWVAKSRIVKYKGKSGKSKGCKKRKPRCPKKKTKKKVSKRKKCQCKKLKGYCPCHKKEKDKTENVITKPLQSYIRYKSKRKRKQERILSDLI